MFILQMMLSPWALVNIEMLISPLARALGQENELETRATTCEKEALKLKMLSFLHLSCLFTSFIIAR